MIATGFGLTTTVKLIVAEHPSAENPVTVYVVEVFNVAVTEVLSAPLGLLNPVGGNQ